MSSSEISYSNHSITIKADNNTDFIPSLAIDTIPPVSDEVLLMLGFFSAIGTLGNALVLYGFSRMLRQNLTSTVFVLTLAGTDLLTSFVIIPSTIYMEHAKYHISNDVFCKLYHFLLTSSVPYSIFLMVAIAVDRYLCICQPFLHCMTIRRARSIVIFLSILAILLGITASLFYGVFPVQICQRTTNISTDLDETMWKNLSLDILSDMYTNVSSIPLGTYEPTQAHNVHTVAKVVSHTTSPHTYGYSHAGPCVKSIKLLCDRNNDILGDLFQIIFQRIYSSLFLVAVVVVSCLYVLIYRAVMLRRRKTQRLRSSHVITSNHRAINNTPHSVNGSITVCEPAPTSPSKRIYRKISLRRNSKNRKLSRRSEKVFIENMRTATTLFIVTIVFIVVFLPSWLMALKIITTNVSVFYLYFLHGVINPFIYAFMNETFRKTVRYIGKCDRRRSESLHVNGGISQSTC